mmetsp:Transcript_5558/g.6419  ORF Transcript_5558/g.6419 Transcript_5558/m.6419 type:complete len:222 (+) Transcript_5558:19-684(+)
MILNNCKLTYFGIPGRGESIRLALSIGKVPFTDDRITFPEWKEIKPNTPWGSLPVLTLSDGSCIAQQRAILRFVGKEVGLYPMNDNLAAAKVDEIMDAAEDIGATTMKAGQGLEKNAKEAARKVACEEGGAVYNLLKRIDAVIGGNGYAVGDSLTIADLYLYTGSCNLVSGLYDGVPVDTLDGFENIMQLRRAVRSHAEVCKWYDSMDDQSKLPASYSKLI